MNISITFEGGVDGEMAMDSQELSEIIKREIDHPVEIERVGVEAKGVVEHIQLIQVGLQSLTLLFAALTFFKSQKPCYSYQIKKGNLTMDASNISKEDFLELARRVEGQENPHMEIKIKK